MRLTFKLFDPKAWRLPTCCGYADASVFEHAPRYRGGGVAGSDLLPDEVPIIARRGELVVPTERVVREQEGAGAQRPITVVINVTAADAGCFARARVMSPPTWRTLLIGRGRNR